MAATKVQFGARISKVAKALIDLERQQLGTKSDGEAVESLILRASTSKEARYIIIQEAEKDPLFAAAIKTFTGK